MGSWFRNVWYGVTTVMKGMWVTLRTMGGTYRHGTFTAKYEYPEKPAVIEPRFRGFHRYDFTTCIGCEACAKACPADCIYITREKAPKPMKGWVVHGYTIDYGKCLFCGQCVPVCPVDCLAMGHQYDISCYARERCTVDFTRIPLETAWGEATLNQDVVGGSKAVAEPVWDKVAAAAEAENASPTEEQPASE